MSELVKLPSDRRGDPLALSFQLSTQSGSYAVVHPVLGHVASGKLNYSKVIQIDEVGHQGFMQLGTGHAIGDALYLIRMLEWLLRKAADDERFDTSSVRAVTGAAQQHFVIWLNQTFWRILAGAEKGAKLHEILRGGIANPFSTMWRNSAPNLDAFAQAIERGFPRDTRCGKTILAELTGTGPQARFFAASIWEQATNMQGYWDATSSVQLLSWLISSILMGKEGPAAFGDSSGGHVMNIANGVWDPAILEALETVIPNLGNKLPTPAPAWEPCGKVSKHIVDTYGFHPDCLVLPAEGDNPDGQIGSGRSGETTEIHGRPLQAHTISLASSGVRTGSPGEDAKFDPDFGSALLRNASGPGTFYMLCFSNSTLVYKAWLIRKGYVLPNGEINWAKRDELLESVPPGNGGKGIIFTDGPEILPKLDEKVCYRYGGLSEGNDAEELAAIVTWQALQMWYFGEWAEAGIEALIAVGGASQSRAVMQIFADVFGVPIYVVDVEDAVVTGGAYRAAAVLDGGVSIAEQQRRHVKYGEAIEPKNTKAYEDLREGIGDHIAAVQGAQ